MKFEGWVQNEGVAGVQVGQWGGTRAGLNVLGSRCGSQPYSVHQCREKVSSAHP